MLTPLAPIIAPSILSADFANLGAGCELVTKAGAEWIHVDVMDGHFVPNISIGVPVVKSLRKASDAVLDVHLMISDPAKYVAEFLRAGADMITFHIEADENPRPILNQIHDASRKGGLAIKPGTDIEEVYPFLDCCDMILVMTVEPGFGGQSFMPAPLEKIQKIHERAAALGKTIDVQVDGGIDLKTLPLAREAGANVFVAGSAIFGQKDPAQAVQEFRNRLS